MHTGPAFVGHTSFCKAEQEAIKKVEEAKHEAEEAAVPEEQAAEPPAD